MNKQRREEIEKLSSQLEDIKEQVSSLMDEEQEYYDNMPESLQGGEKGSTAEQAVSDLESACTSIDEAIDYLNNVTS